MKQALGLGGSVGYAVGQVGLGLLLHPYQTMQSLVRERVFVWMALLPTAVLAGLTIVWRFVLVPIGRLWVRCEGVGADGGAVCLGFEFLGLWVLFFCLYWQILLLYLLFRFRWGYGE